MKDKNTFESEAVSEKPDDSTTKSEAAFTPGTQSKRNQNTSRADRLITGGAWLIAISLVILVGYLALQTHTPFAAANALDQSGVESNTSGEPAGVNDGTTTLLVAPGQAETFVLPVFHQDAPPIQSVSRRTMLHTIIPTRPRDEVTTYTVVSGDSVFSIAKNFNIQPETVLWANYDLLKDSPDTLSIGMDLNIPPTDGVYYEWKEGDIIEDVANRFKAKAEAIINWPGNDLDLVEPSIEPGQKVLVPGGQRELVQWVVPTIPRGSAGVSKSVYGAGACEGSYDGAYGSGSFVWPSANHVLSGNDYWSGHLGIDIAAAVGDGIFSSDSGVIVFSGWAYGGYGNMIMVDHGNGYQTVYAHLSAASARCGQSVSQGQYIGAAGSTGNSTGAHLHFEVRYMGGFINPWYVLP